MERVVIFLHGIEVHSGAFRFVGPELANDHSEVYAFDRRGFGNSKEQDLPRGDTHDFDRHLQDVDDFVDFVNRNHPGKELFLFGHSIGCAYALWYAANHPEKIAGLILASPPLEMGFKLPRQDTLKLALSPVYHHHSMYNLIDEWPQTFKVSEEYQLISDDPLSTKIFGLGYLFDAQTKLTNNMPHNASKVNNPVLLLHGDKDVIALPKSSEDIRDKLESDDKRIQTFEGGDHWLYQSIIPNMGSKYNPEVKRKVSVPAREWLKLH
ncbi:MAG: alpha/beta fold hydrolase [Methanomassiliicoccus sp.]|nr:alpha/beta fold hydrolase [Methanomassiliicoccus sp.]